MRKITAGIHGCGHRATRGSLLMPDFDRDLHRPAMFEINSQVGNPPVGTSYGIELKIPDLHFKKRAEEGGVTPFLPP